jgi:YidC/Oxa1 family membrane protein insertase
MESMKRMKEFAPHLEKLKKKYKDNKVKLAQAQSDLYKQNGINPASGCLPYLLQIVILIAFFNVFTHTLSGGIDTTERFNQLLYQPLKFRLEEKVNTKFLYMDVSKPDVFHVSGLPFPIPGPIIFLAAVIQFLSSKIMAPVTDDLSEKAKKTPQSGDDIQSAMQQSMIYTFPLLTLFFGINFPSGLAIYWLLFSAWQLIQQYNTYGWGGLKPWLLRLNLIKS